MTIRFLFVGEGSSDRALVPPLETLCLREGAFEARGTAPDFRRPPLRSGHSVEEKLQAALQLNPDVDLVFVHRDSDAPSPDRRVQEIEQARETVKVVVPLIPVVPVYMTEAWALLDETAIRRAADNPNGRTVLDLPSPSQVESITNPKAHLEAQLLKASEHSGRHRKRFKRSLARRKFALIEQIDIDGPIHQVPAWRCLCEKVQEAINTLKATDDNA